MTGSIDSLLEQVTAHVAKYMSQYDASHDYSHIQRVLSVAKSIEAQERLKNPHMRLRGDLVTLAALLHDIGDRKYTKPGQDGPTMVLSLLKTFGADDQLAQDVQIIVNHVSYSSEIKHPSKVQECLRRYPELAIVQDADRLDAIGAVGVARCFAYNSAAGYTLGDAVQHFEDKLVKLGSMMKTQTGRQMAAVRTKRLLQFREWWIEEAQITTSDLQH